jgi:hypothetical protein
MILWSGLYCVRFHIARGLSDCGARLNISLAKFLRIVRFEVFTEVTVKNAVFCVVTPCGSCNNRRFGGTWRLLHQSDKNR